MSRFVVRIELRDSESADYDELHEKLASHGFKRTLLNSDYDPVWLPNAEYLYETETNGIYYVGHLAKVVSEKSGLTQRSLLPK